MIMKTTTKAGKTKNSVENCKKMSMPFKSWILLYKIYLWSIESFF